MNISDFTNAFPHVRHEGGPLTARNILSVTPEDGSGLSFNLTMWVNDSVVPAYVRFDKVTRRPVAVSVDGQKCTWY